MQNKDKGDGIEDCPLDMLLVILLEGASKEVITPSSKCHKKKKIFKFHNTNNPFDNLQQVSSEILSNFMKKNSIYLNCK